MEQIIDGIIIAVGLFCLCGWTYRLLKRRMARNSRNRVKYGSSMLLIVLGVIYACMFLYIMVLMHILGNADLIIYSLLVLISLVSIVWMIAFLVKNRRTISVKMLLMFGIVFAAVMYVTIISRRGAVETGVKMQVFLGLREALESGSWDNFSHFIMNIVMFIPLGFFFAGIKQDITAKTDKVLLLGVSLATFIESVQLLFRWGECDIDDIIANTIGAVFGLLIYKLFIRTEILRNK